MTTIWKYQLYVTDEQDISLPKGAVPLSIQAQDGMPQLWAIVDDTDGAEKEQVTILTVATGAPLPVNCGRFLGTYQLFSGDFVGHVFLGSN